MHASYRSHVLALLLALAAGLLPACASAAPAAPPPESNRMDSDHAPTPFSAEQIRVACPVGRVDTFLIESGSRPPARQITRFVGANSNGAIFEARMETTDGRAIGEPLRSRASWVGLQEHASHPESATVITEDSIRVPAGSFDCWVYTVTTGTDVQRLYFAKSLPGPPVRAVQEVGGEVQMEMTLLEHRMEER